MNTTTQATCPAQDIKAASGIDDSKHDQDIRRYNRCDYCGGGIVSAADVAKKLAEYDADRRRGVGQPASHSRSCQCGNCDDDGILYTSYT